MSFQFKYLFLCFSCLLMAQKEVRLGDPAGPKVAGEVVALEHGAIDNREGQVLFRNANEQVWGLPINVPGASFLKLYFENYRLAMGDSLQIYDALGNLRQTLNATGPGSQSDFWSLSIPGDTAWLEIRSSNDYQRRNSFQVTRAFKGNLDLFAVGLNRSACADPRALDYRAAWCYSGGQSNEDPSIWDNAQASVGVLTIGNLGSGTWCSGSLVSSQDYVITNQHCIENLSGCATTEFIFNYYTQSCTTGLSNVFPLTSQGYYCDNTDPDNFFTNSIGDCTPQNLEQLDYAFCHVLLNAGAPSPSSIYPVLEMEQDQQVIENTTDLYLIGQPDGKPRVVSEGVMDFTSPYGLHYLAQTLGGSSGSPIFSKATHRMIGLHHCGGCDTSSERNRGMFISQIREDLDSRGSFFEPAPRLAVTALELSDATGDDDGYFDFGETIEVQIRVANLGNLESGEGSISITGDLGVNFTGQTQFVVPALAPFANSSQELSFSIHFSLDSRVLACGDSFNLNVSLDHDGIQRSTSTLLPVGGFGESIGDVGDSIFNLSIPIPDNSSVPALSSLNLEEQGVVKSVRSVQVEISHTYIGDLVVKLIAPNGAETILHNQSGGSSHNINLTYGDGTNGTTLPAGSFNSLKNAPIAGDWQLSVTDRASGDTGNILGWGLTLEAANLDCNTAGALLSAASVEAVHGGQVSIPIQFNAALAGFSFELLYDVHKLAFTGSQLDSLVNCTSTNLQELEPGRIRVSAACDGTTILGQLLRLEFQVLAISSDAELRFENLSGGLSGVRSANGFVNLPESSALNPCEIELDQYILRWEESLLYDPAIDFDQNGRLDLLDQVERLNCPAP